MSAEAFEVPGRRTATAMANKVFPPIPIPLGDFAALGELLVFQRNGRGATSRWRNSAI